MWEKIDTDQDTTSETTWLADGMTNSLLIWVTDGSYNQKKEQDLSSIGWIILLYQDREETDGYLLGEVNWGKLVSCGNARPLCTTSTSTGSGRVLQGCEVVCHSLMRQQTLELSLHHRCRIRPSAKCANIRQNLRAIKQSFTGAFKYIHVSFSPGGVSAF